MMNQKYYPTVNVWFSTALVLIVADALFPAPAATLETVQRNFTRKMESIQTVHIEYISIDTASLNDWQDILVRVMDYNLKEKSGRELFNFLSEPSITVGHFQSDGVDSVVRPCREFLRPSLSNKTDVIFEEMNRRYERERWLNLDELTQMHCLPFITNAFAAVTDGAPSNSIILKYTNQIVSINIIYDWQRDIVSSLTSTLTNGATIEYSYGAFKETSLGIFPYLMRYGTPRRAFHTREFRISKLSFNSPWKAEIASFNIPYGTTVADARFTPELTYQQGKHQYKDEELIQLAADSKAGKIVKMGIAAEAPMPLKDIQRKQRPILFYALITVILLSPFAVFIVRRRFA